MNASPQWWKSPQWWIITYYQEYDVWKYNDENYLFLTSFPRYFTIETVLKTWVKGISSKIYNPTKWRQGLSSPQLLEKGII